MDILEATSQAWRQGASLYVTVNVQMGLSSKVSRLLRGFKRNGYISANPTKPAGMTDRNLILATELAREKGCSAQAIYNAIDRGDLTEIRLGRFRLVVRDEKSESYEVRETGGRANPRYREKHSGT